MMVMRSHMVSSSRAFFHFSSLFIFISHYITVINIPAVVRSPIGGDVISEQLQYMLDEQNIEVVPTYKIGGKVGHLDTIFQYVARGRR